MGCGASNTYKQPRKIETKWFHQFESELPSQQGKVVCITGCTSGTGFVAAKALARKGAHVVMLNRKSSRAEEAEKKILEEAPGSKVTSVECDLQTFENVKSCAEKLKAMFSDTGVDVLCNNAGVMALADEATKDGYDVQMQTNHLSHFLLTKEIFPLLQKGAELRGEARIVNHSSAAREKAGAVTGKVLDAKYLGKNGGNLGGNSKSVMFGGARWQRYHQTKLANVVFTLALDDRLKACKSKVKAVVCAPGLAATNLQVTANQNDGMSDTWIMRYGQSAEDGTMPLLHCCAGAGVEGGDFYEPKIRKLGMRLIGPVAKFELEKICTKEESRQILWEESEKACGEFKIE